MEWAWITSRCSMGIQQAIGCHENSWRKKWMIILFSQMPSSQLASVPPIMASLKKFLDKNYKKKIHIDDYDDLYMMTL